MTGTRRDLGLAALVAMVLVCGLAFFAVELYAAPLPPVGYRWKLLRKAPRADGTHAVLARGDAPDPSLWARVPWELGSSDSSQLRWDGVKVRLATEAELDAYALSVAETAEANTREEALQALLDGEIRIAALVRLRTRLVNAGKAAAVISRVEALITAENARLEAAVGVLP